jgi:hypothetical protein
MFGNPVKNRALIFLLSFALSILPVGAQTTKNAEIKRIDAYVKTLDALAKRNKQPHLIAADTSDYENAESKPKWQKFASEKALEKFREENGETYSIAYNWRQRGRIVKSNFTLFSPSGDWTQYDNHYFRDNGTIAKIESELRTFYGEMIVLRNFYFDGKGKLLRQTIRYRDLNTKRPVKKPKDGAFQDSEVQIYKTIGRLPFADLLKK